MRGMLSRLGSLVVVGALLGGCSPVNPGNDVTNPGDGGVDVRDTGTGGDTTGMDIVRADMAVAEGGQPDVVTATCGNGLGVCNPVTNSGCMSGQACVSAGDGDGGVTTQCVMARTGGFGDPCTRADACREGMACLGSPGRCVLLCCTPGDNEPCRDPARGGRPNAICGGGINGTDMHVCETTAVCDWFAQDCPSATDNCMPIDQSGTTRCEPAGTATNGQPCPGSVNCARGLICIMDATGPLCRPICDPTFTGGDAGMTTVPRTCPSGFMCNGINLGPMMPAPDNFGVCVPMGG